MVSVMPCSLYMCWIERIMRKYIRERLLYAHSNSNMSRIGSVSNGGKIYYQKSSQKKIIEHVLHNLWLILLNHPIPVFIESRLNRKPDFNFVFQNTNALKRHENNN